jgi:hypothetical protein
MRLLNNDLLCCLFREGHSLPKFVVNHLFSIRTRSASKIKILYADHGKDAEQYTSQTIVFKASDGFLDSFPSNQVASGLGGRVHSRFLERFRLIERTLYHYLRLTALNNDKNKITFVGNGVGGVIAALAALQTKVNFPATQLQLIMYNTPLDWDADMTAALNDKVHRIIGWKETSPLTYYYVDPKDLWPFPTHYTKGEVWRIDGQSHCCPQTNSTCLLNTLAHKFESSQTFLEKPYFTSEICPSL